MKSKLLVILLVLLATACAKHIEKAETDLNIGYEVKGDSLKGNGQDVFRIKKPIDNKKNTAMKKEKLAEELKNAMQKAAPKPHFWNLESVKERWEDITENDKDHS